MIPEAAKSPLATFALLFCVLTNLSMCSITTVAGMYGWAAYFAVLLAAGVYALKVRGFRIK